VSPSPPPLAHPFDRWITTSPLQSETLLAETADPRCGALVVFGGTVREHNEGRPVDGMHYDAHIELAARTLAALEAEVCERFGVLHCRVQHRIGALALEELSVLVVVRSAHRAAAFEAGRYAIDTLKERLPVWKHEHYTDGDARYLDGTPLTPEPESR
jgi:molybdopterin synthase catalytic subunit